MKRFAFVVLAAFLAACTQTNEPSASASASGTARAATAIPTSSASATVAAGRAELRILTPENNASVGDARGAGWFIDILTRGGSTTVAGGTAAPTASASASPASTSGAATGLLCPNPTAAAAQAPGPNAGFPGLVVLVSTNSDPNQNVAGLFQVGIEDSGSARECQAVFHETQAGRFGVGVDTTVTAFVVEGTAPATVPTDRSGLRLISNEATAKFHINGQRASGAPTTASPSAAGTPAPSTASPTPSPTPTKTP